MRPAAAALVIGMQPAPIVHDKPKCRGVEFSQIRNDQGKHALHTLVVQGSGKMMVINQIVVAIGTQDDGDHVFAQISCRLLALLPAQMTATLLDLSQPDGDLGGSQVRDQYRPHYGSNLGIHLYSWRVLCIIGG